MRISAGQLKGRKVAFPRIFSKKTGGELRPTSAKVREALFDILRNEIHDARFLDLYAGTGAVGFEALSRGARQVVFVELDQRHYESIVQCIQRLGTGDRTAAYKDRAMFYLKRLVRAPERFDIIFADPPYASEVTAELLSLIDAGDLLGDSGCLIIEHASRAALVVPETVRSLRRVKDYRYGDTMLTLFRRGRGQ